MMAVSSELTSQIRQAAHRDHESVLALARDLVRIPSRGGIDPYGPVLEHMESWLAGRGLPCRRLNGPGGGTAALACEVSGFRPGPRYVLDACLDTAPFGDKSAGSRPPLSGEVSGGWLHGRGAADSKTGVAVFAHLAARLAARPGSWSGSVVLLLDVDEHTGGFGGAKAYFGIPGAAGADGVMIGYPGPDHVITGGRGCFRARVRVRGASGHSGSSKPVPSAIAKAAGLVSRLHRAEMPGPVPGFPLPARLTVTAISGGEGYSVVPDLCEFNVDVRLTPALDSRAAGTLLRAAAAETDDAWPGTPPTTLETVTCWPPYALADGHPLRSALVEAAAANGLSATARIAGPSNIGCYLAGLGIPATAGFGVEYTGLHAVNEKIAVASIPAVQAAYHQALLALLPAPSGR